ncbi:MAG: hypothetical protein JW888_06085 [Pirellulales bacterium]|nr:hypothetical protein [Pirellulales bacterium]
MASTIIPPTSSLELMDFALGTAPSLWHKSAPGRLRKARKEGSADEVWSVWTSYLARRKTPKPLDRDVAPKDLPLLWALPDGVEDEGTRGLIERLSEVEHDGGIPEATLEEEALLWMTDAAAGRWKLGYGLEAVAFSRVLPGLAGVLSSATWWNLLSYLVASSVEAAQWSVFESPLVHQWVAGEVALTLAYWFPELIPCRKLARAGRRALAAGLAETLDGEGLPRAENLDELRPLLACWTRCQALGKSWKRGCFERGAAEQFEWAVRQALRWTRPDGTQVLARSSAGAASADWLAVAVGFDDDKDDHDIAAVVLPGGKKSKKSRARRFLAEAASHSEWSCAAVLRPEWSQASPHLSILYPGQTVYSELSTRGDLVWSGCWEWEVRLDDRPLRPESDWEETCWVSDDDADFLELEIELSEGVRLERQMIMAREDRVLLLADAILGTEPAAIEYRGCLPLEAGVSLDGMPETREAYLVARRRAALVLPLALPEWQGGRGVGTLQQTAAGLELRQQAKGCSMYCPLLFDLDPRRMTRRRTWRQLTVAAERVIQPADVAVGYRVHSGRDQWLIYRSLAERANRTLLGHNLSSEMLFARFDEAGEVEPLVEVE